MVDVGLSEFHLVCVCVCVCNLVSILVVCFLSFPFLSFTCVLINFYKHQ